MTTSVLAAIGMFYNETIHFENFLKAIGCETNCIFREYPWAGVGECPVDFADDNSRLFDHLRCNSKGRVVRITLTQNVYNGNGGTITTEIAMFPELQHLQLPGLGLSKLVPPLPSTLTSFDIGRNLFEGLV
jgi:hypothetical protein